MSIPNIKNKINSLSDQDVPVLDYRKERTGQKMYFESTFDQ